MFSRFNKSKEKKIEAYSAPPKAEPSRRELYVEVVEARGLMKSNPSGTADAFVTAVMSDLGGREIKTESFKTGQKSGTLAPVWKEKFTFGNFLLEKIFVQVN